MNPVFPTPVAAAFAGLAGLLFGSFIGLCVYRLPRGKRITGRSQCPGCTQMIPAWRNLPLISYAVQRGRCASCGQRIHWRYPTCEAVCGALALACWQAFPIGWALIAAFALCLALVLLSVIDIEHLELPDEITRPLLWLGLLFSLSPASFTSPSQAIAGAAVGYGVLALVNAVWKAFRKQEAIGGGDWMLLGALGAWFGPIGAFGVLSAAAVMGAVYGLVCSLFAGKSFQEQVPFGPFLALGGIWVLLDPGSVFSEYIEQPMMRFLG